MLPILFTLALASEPGFEPLLKANLSGWTVLTKDAVDGANTWSVEANELLSTGRPTGCLLTTQESENFILRLEYRLEPSDLKRPNSGVLLHCQPGNTFWPHSYEVQLARGEAGDLWLQPDAAKNYPELATAHGQAKARDPVRHFPRVEVPSETERPPGEWNRLEIQCSGLELKVILNDVVVNHATKLSLKRGRIGLQAEGAAIRFRHLELRSEPDRP